MSIFWSPSLGGFVDEATHGPRMVLVVDEEAVATLQDKRASVAALVDEIEGKPASAERDEAIAATKAVLVAADDELANPPRIWIDNPDTRIPADAVAISAEEHAALMAAVAGGQKLISDERGMPVAVDHVLSIDEQLAQIRRRRDRDLAATDWTQSPDAMAAAKRKLWAQHRQALRDLPKIVQEALERGKAIETVPYPQPPS